MRRERRGARTVVVAALLAFAVGGAVARSEALVLPLDLERVDEVLPWQHIVVCRKR